MRHKKLQVAEDNFEPHKDPKNKRDRIENLIDIKITYKMKTIRALKTHQKQKKCSYGGQRIR